MSYEEEEAKEAAEVEQTTDIGKIFCIGDSRNYLKFDIANMKWS